MSWIYRLFGLAHSPAPLPDSNPYPRDSHNLPTPRQESGHALRQTSIQEIRMAESSQPVSTEEVPLTQTDEGGGSGEGDTKVVGAGGDVDTEAPEPERETWGSKLGYMLTLVGYAVGFGNIWRFPFLMHTNGGVAFLIPYTIMIAFAGIPIFFLELAVGQRLRKGALGSWNEISPYLGGLGISCGLICYFVELYYNTLVAWVFLYFFDSFRKELPWTSCFTISSCNGWENETRTHLNESRSAPVECLLTNQATQYYWYRRMLDVSDGITDPGNFNVWMLFCLTISWVLVWAIIIKGIKSSEKVVYFTALFPYVTLIIFFGANFSQKGWQDGYRILLNPDWTVLLNGNVWLAAGSQIFFSLGVAYGCLIVFASYLPSNNNCYRDAVWVSIINCGTSLFAAIVLFPVFGSIGTRKFEHCKQDRVLHALGQLNISTPADFYNEDMRKKLTEMFEVKHPDTGNITSITNITMHGNISVTLDSSFNRTSPLDCNLTKFIRSSGSGTGLVFIGFAEAVLHMGFLPPFWSFIFFLMLLTLGIDSSFGTLEGAIAVLVDLKVLKLPRWGITSIVTGSLFFMSLIFCWGWGMYIQVFIDQFVANWSLLIIGFFETIGISYVYGLAKFSYDIKLMTGSRPNMFMLICWKFITPALILAILIMSVVQQFMDGYTYDVYNKLTGEVIEKTKQKTGIIVLGYIIWVGIIIWVPLQAILKKFGKSLLREETPAYFPEEELRAERQMGVDDDEEFDTMDQILMGKSIDDFKAHYRSSKSNLVSLDTSMAVNQPISGTEVSSAPSKEKDGKSNNV